MNNEQRGVALLIVLMLLALMAALAADMTLSFHSQLQRTRQVNHHLQRQYDIELAEKLALASLTQDVKDNDRQTTLQQYWAQPQQLQLEDGNTVKWQLRDAQHCFNLNALAKISDVIRQSEKASDWHYAGAASGFGKSYLLRRESVVSHRHQYSQRLIARSHRCFRDRYRR